MSFLNNLFLMPLANSAAPAGTENVTHMMTELVLQLAVIIIVARIGGYLFQKYLKGPSVLGELLSGIIIGPYALGSLNIPLWGPLFPPLDSSIPVSTELYSLAIIASILLLFLSGLETDLKTFMKYSVAGAVVGLGGLVFAFFLGAWITIPFGIADSIMDPQALFLGTIATATSVGITARILSEKRKMGSAEGVTILAAAVFDDVAGIIVLAIVVGMSKVGAAGGAINWSHIGFIAAKAVGFWIFFTVAGLLLATRITSVLKMFRSNETIAALCLGLAMLIAGLSEMAGLAMIIGAYIMGLALSKTDIVNELQEQLHGVYNLLIPVFFCVMGMMVNFGAMRSTLVFGLVYSSIAVLTKVLGCGLPAMLMKFTPRGALRIGFGMVPRGEVALIVAGIGVSSGLIGQDVFGVAIMMSMLTTVIAPPLLIKSFEGGSGVVGGSKEVKDDVMSIALKFPSDSVADFICGRILNAFRNEEFFVHGLHTDTPTYQIRKEEMTFTLIHDNENITITTPVKYQLVARMIILEEILTLQDLLESVKDMKSPDSMGNELMTGFF